MKDFNDEILKMSDPKKALIKFPGRSPKIETLNNLVETDFKILLHGIVPSSGSLLDPSLCDNLKSYSKFIKLTNATASLVQVLSNETMGDIKIKVSAGIKDLNTALSFVSAGATRIGTSAGDKIIDEFKA